MAVIQLAQIDITQAEQVPANYSGIVAGDDGELYLIDGDSPPVKVNKLRTFSAYQKNLFDLPITATQYTGDRLDSITYGSGPQAYTVTLGYTGDKITTVTLSGAIPAGIPTVKTISYTGDNITGTSYA
jgi:hypothetical protein